MNKCSWLAQPASISRGIISHVHALDHCSSHALCLDRIKGATHHARIARAKSLCSMSQPKFFSAPLHVKYESVPLSLHRSWDLSAGGIWVQDYSPQQPYRSAVGGSTGFVPGPPPQMYYLDGHSPISRMRQAFLPTFAPFELGSVAAELRPLVTEEEVAMLVAAGVNTVAELVSADKYTILKLRGYDVPQVLLFRLIWSIIHFSSYSTSQR